MHAHRSCIIYVGGQVQYAFPHPPQTYGGAECVTGLDQENKGTDQWHYNLPQAPAEGMHNPAQRPEYYVSRLVERQIDKMHEGSSHVVALDGRLEEFNTPDEQKEENDEPSDEVHNLGLILCMEHVIESALWSRSFPGFEGCLPFKQKIVIQGFVPAENKSTAQAFAVFIILFQAALGAVHIASFKFGCCSGSRFTRVIRSFQAVLMGHPVVQHVR